MKFFIISMLLVFSQLVMAQETQNIKVVTVEKTVNEIGDTIIVEKVLEGDEASEYINQTDVKIIKHEQTEDIKVIKKREEVTENDNGETHYLYELVIKDQDGKKNKMKWEGTDKNELPEEMKIYFIDGEDDIENLDVEINQREEKQYEFESGEDEIVVPEDVKSELQDDGSLKIIGIRGYAGDEPPKDKAQLGVMIADHENGVLITDTVSGSSASEGGLLSGDIITGLDGEDITSVKSLISKVSEFYAGDKITIDFIRNAESMQKSFILKKRIPRTWNEALGKK